MIFKIEKNHASVIKKINENDGNDENGNEQRNVTMTYQKNSY